MAQVSPWSVKGVDTAAREAAKNAARQAGVPIGVWLSRAILAVAQGAAGAANNGSQGMASGLTGGTNLPVPHPANAATNAVVEENIEMLKRRCRELEEKLSENLDPLSRKLRNLSGQVEELDSMHAKVRTLLRHSESLEKLGDVSLKLKQLDAIPHVVEQAAGKKIGEQGARLRELAEAVEEIKKHAGGVVTTAPMERALMRLADRVQKLEDAGS